MVYDSFNEDPFRADSLGRVHAVLLKNFTNESYDFSSALQTRSFSFFHKSLRAFPLLLDFITSPLRPPSLSLSLSLSRHYLIIMEIITRIEREIAYLLFRVVYNIFSI